MGTAFWGTMSLRLVVWFGIGGLVMSAGADEPSVPRRGALVVEVRPLVAGPADASQWEAWREGLYAERRRMRARLGYDGGLQEADFAAKFLLMRPGLDRCATIGFRCVVDLADPNATVE
jgi:hypothetical protein